MKLMYDLDGNCSYIQFENCERLAFNSKQEALNFMGVQS